MNPQLKPNLQGRPRDCLSFTEQCLHQLLLSTEGNRGETADGKQLELALTVLERGDFRERWEVAKIVPKLGTEAVAPLLELLQDETADLEARWFAARILAGFDRVDTILGLAEVLATAEDSDLVEITASALTHFGAAAVRVLAPLLECAPLQQAATRALSQIRSPETLEPLLSVARAPNAVVRATALEALASFRDPRIISALIEGLGDLAAAVRKEAAIGLGYRADLAAEYNLLNYLRPLLYDFNLEVCQQAAIAIGKFPEAEAERCLFETLASAATPLPLQLTLLQVLAWRETAGSLRYLQQALSFLKSEALLFLLRALGRIRTEELQTQAAQMLLDFYRSPSPFLAETEIKQALAHSLGQLQRPAARSVLQTLAEDVENSVQLHAIAALKRLAC